MRTELFGMRGVPIRGAEGDYCNYIYNNIIRTEFRNWTTLITITSCTILKLQDMGVRYAF